jgi:hypothetical protein
LIIVLSDLHIRDIALGIQGVVCGAMLNDVFGKGDIFSLA